MDNLSDSSAKAGSSVKGAKDSIDDLGDASSKTGSNLKGTESAVDGVSDSASRAGSSIKGTSDSLDGLSDSGGNASQGVKGASDSVDGLTDSSARAGTSVKGAGDAIDNLGDSGAQAGQGVKGAEASINSLSDSSGRAGTNVKGASDSLENLSDSGAQAGRGVKGAEDSMNSLSDSSGRAGSSVKGTSDSLDNLGDSGANTSKNLKGADSAIDSVADSSTNASQSVKGASDSLSGLSDSGADATKGLKGADSVIDGVADSSVNAQQGVKGASDSLDGLSDSGARAGKDIKGADDTIDGLSDSSANASQGLKGTSDSLDGMSDSATNAAQSAKNVNDETEQMDGKTQKASIGFKDLATSLGLVAIASAAFDVLKQSMDDAISRFDTLNQFPRVLNNLGVSADEAEKAMTRLSDGIDGLPTTLDDISASTQEMYTSFNDIDKATDTALALNNALLGSGASAEQAKRGTQQYNKALQTGKFDLMMWNTLSETMGVGLIEIAKGFGYAGNSAKNDLYNALQDGTVTLDQFNDELIKVGTGTGIMADLAKENSKGIATSLTNLKNTAAKGIANILDSFDRLSVAVTGNDIAENIDAMKHAINASFTVIQGVIEATIPFFKGFAEVVKFAFPLVEALTPAILGLASAYVALMIIKTTLTAIEQFALALQGSTAIAKMYELAILACNNVLKVYTGQLTLAMAVEKAHAVLQTAGTAILAASTLAYNVLTGAVTIATAAKIALAGAITVVNTALTALSGPVGWIILGVGALVGAVVGLVSWFNRTSEEAEALNAKNEELSESTDALNESLEQSATAYGEQQTEIESNAVANASLAEKVGELAEKENKSVEEKALLKDYTEMLNENVDDLNLSYDEEADALNMTSEEMRKKIDLMAEQASYEAALERQVEIAKEQHEVDMKMKETNALKRENEELFESGEITRGEYNKATKDLEETEDSLKEKEKQLAEQQKITEEQVVSSMEAMAGASKDGVAVNKQAVLDWIEKNEELADSMRETYGEIYDTVTDTFNRISTKSDVSLQEMNDNLDHNLEAVEEWGENQAALIKWAGDEGYDNLIPKIEEMGIDQAGELKEMVKGLDDSNQEHVKLLDELGQKYEEAGDTTWEAYKKSQGEGMEDSLDAMKNFITEQPKTMRQSVKDADFASVGKAITDDFGNDLVDDMEKAFTPVKELIAEQPGSLTQSVKDADFKSVGTNMTDGVAGGVDDGKSVVEKSTKNMGKDAKTAVENVLGIHSPSTVFAEIGKNITEGLVQGINKGSGKVKKSIRTMFKSVARDSKVSFKNITRSYDQAIRQIEKTLMKLPKATQKQMQRTSNALKMGSLKQMAAMSKMANYHRKSVSKINKVLSKLPKIAQKSMNAMTARLKIGSMKQRAVMKTLATGLRTPFNGISGKFRTIGVNAMSGLRSGLNAGKGSVMSTARGIANSVSKTMKKSLKIKSPSRVMRDDVGKWIPEGIALGIKDNAKSVFKELDNLSGDMVMGTPEQALGVNKMAYNTGNQFVDAIKNLKMPSGGGSRNKEQVIIIKPTTVEMDGRTVGEITWRPVKENIDRNDEIIKRFT